MGKAKERGEAVVADESGFARRSRRAPQSMSEHENATDQAPASRKAAGFVSSIDGTLMTGFAAIAALASLLLGGLVFMSLRSLSRR